MRSISWTTRHMFAEPQSRNHEGQVRLLAHALTAALAAFSASGVSAASAWINELHYDNEGTDYFEAIEIAGAAGTNLNGWSLLFYNGSTGTVYGTSTFGVFILDDQSNGFGFKAFAYGTNSIQNGPPDGIALVDDTNTVIQFLSYEGSFTADGGPADGLTSTDIGVSEDSSTPAGYSLQLVGCGSSYAEFSWAAPQPDTFNAVNTGQSFVPCLVEIPFDVKPQSCPNPLNIRAKGVIPAAVLGTGDLDVTTIDVASLRLEGVPPLRSAVKDVGTPFEPVIGKQDAFDCNDFGPDGLMDLTLKFAAQEVIASLGDVEGGEVKVLTLTGNLKEEFGGTPINGEDVVVILKRQGRNTH